MFAIDFFVFGCALRVGLVRIAFALFLLSCSNSSLASEWGEYIGRVVAEWQGGGTEMRLVEEFGYKDPKGNVWRAPIGSIVDGASIPRIAWSIIGGPFEGKYRDASVIHDVACVSKVAKWEDVHEVFYTAMLASGVDPLLAKVMYGAVYHFGPRWERKFRVRGVPSTDVDSRMRSYLSLSNESRQVVAFAGNRRTVGGSGGPLASQGGVQSRDVFDITVRIIPVAPRLSEREFLKLRNEIEKSNFSLDQIREFKP
jgi:Protein of unknown function (DUF1353)